jgi:hypothetical protein
MLKTASQHGSSRRSAPYRQWHETGKKKKRKKKILTQSQTESTGVALSLIVIQIKWGITFVIAWFFWFARVAMFRK